MVQRAKSGLAPYKMLKHLQKHGITETEITFDRAHKAMDYLASTGWGKTTNPAKLRAIALERVPGED